MTGQIVWDPDHVIFGEEVEYARYFRFNEVLQERRYRPGDAPHKPPTGSPVEVDRNAVTDMRPSPKMKDYLAGSPLWRMTLECNKMYMQLLSIIQVGVHRIVRQAETSDPGNV